MRAENNQTENKNDVIQFFDPNLEEAVQAFRNDISLKPSFDTLQEINVIVKIHHNTSFKIQHVTLLSLTLHR